MGWLYPTPLITDKPWPPRRLVIGCHFQGSLSVSDNSLLLTIVLDLFEERFVLEVDVFSKNQIGQITNFRKVE